MVGLRTRSRLADARKLDIGRYSLLPNKFPTTGQWRGDHLSAIALWLPVWTASAQTRPAPERLAAVDKAMANAKDQAIMKLPTRLQKALSGGALNYLQLITAWQNIQNTYGEGPDSEAKLAALRSALESARTPAGVVTSGPIPVSNPGTDFLFSVMAGFTQSETSTAWCGSGAVVGFNDSGSEFETTLFGPPERALHPMEAPRFGISAPSTQGPTVITSSKEIPFSVARTRAPFITRRSAPAARCSAPRA